MKSLLVLGFLAVLPQLAQAALVCQEIAPSSSHHVYSVVASSSSASVRRNGKQVATLRLVSDKAGKAEEPSSKTYRQVDKKGQTVANGLVLEVSAGGIVGPMATLFQAGIAGNTEIASLPSCTQN